MLIALHGRGSSSDRNFLSWEPIIQMGWMLAMPQSSQLGSPNSFVWDDAALAKAEIANQYRQLLEEYPVDQKRVILAGFSQGAGLAIQICLQGLIPARGFLAVAPALRCVESLEDMMHVARGKRGYLVVGGRDRRYEMITQIHAFLNRNGIPCEMEEHPQMGHEFPQDFDQSIRRALRFLLA
jgi:predicted esterase